MRTIDPGTFLCWLQGRLAGRVGGQSKVPRLSMETAIVGEILALLPPDRLNGVLAGTASTIQSAVHALVERTD